ncbi:MAG: IS4 family transposase [Polyangiaceae bacterium]|nr:IS4 family transposase [Polyangiaceae bacterium]
MNSGEWLAGDVATEFDGSELGDPRRERRLGKIASKLGDDPGASFPDVFSTGAELEGFYRFLRNDSFDWTDVLKPHVEATCARAEELGECLAIHDTTNFIFKGERDGLGPTSSKAQGFIGHLSLLVGMDDARTPLGVGAIDQYVRAGRKGRRSVGERLDDKTSEGQRWLKGAEAINKLAKDRFECIHVADREGDTFPFLSGMLEFGGRFVIRVAQNRRVLDEDEELTRLHEVVLGLKAESSFDITVSKRGKRLNPTQAKSHPSREGRNVTVSIAGTSVCVAVPVARRKAMEIEMNLVRVWEENPDPNEPSVEWILWTTEPTGTIKQLRRVVEIYRARWVIEEYFKALKTGCQFERRQLESFDTLSTALALFAPVAWKLLLARSVVRSIPDSPPDRVISRAQVAYLEGKYKKPLHTARDALYAMAKLGGHLSQNGEPGWLTLGRGYEKLATGEAFYQEMIRLNICDQS